MSLKQNLWPRRKHSQCTTLVREDEWTFVNLPLGICDFQNLICGTDEACLESFSSIVSVEQNRTYEHILKMISTFPNTKSYQVKDDICKCRIHCLRMREVWVFRRAEYKHQEWKGKFNISLLTLEPCCPVCVLGVNSILCMKVKKLKVLLCVPQTYAFTENHCDCFSDIIQL